MGLFDAECAVTGISLLPIARAACVPLAPSGDDFVVRGDAVFGPTNRAGSVDAPDVPAPPFALVAAPVFDAIVANVGDLGHWLAERGIPLRPIRDDGRQHTSGDVLDKHARAVRTFDDVPWMQAALAECAAIAERRTALLLEGEAPRAGWLADAAASWYGVIIGGERRASTSRDGLRADIELLAGGAFDPETLRIEPHLAVLAVVRGEPVRIDLRRFLTIVNAGERARLDDTERAEAVNALYDGTDPRVELAWDSLEEELPVLEPPLARDRSDVWIGTPFHEAPPWARRGETAYGLTKFATVDAGGWQPPPPRPPVTSMRPISDDEILAVLRADGLLAAIRLYQEKTGAGLAEAKHAMETWRAKL